MLEGVLGRAAPPRRSTFRGYALAGKTGTSQKVIDGTYSDTQFVASFVGFAPADDPKLLVAVIVDDPKGDYYGGTVAAPAFGEIASSPFRTSASRRRSREPRCPPAAFLESPR